MAVDTSLNGWYIAVHVSARSGARLATDRRLNG
jgi:hypothetical protein